MQGKSEGWRSQPTRPGTTSLRGRYLAIYALLLAWYGWGTMPGAGPYESGSAGHWLAGVGPVAAFADEPVGTESVAAKLEYPPTEGSTEPRFLKYAEEQLARIDLVDRPSAGGAAQRPATPREGRVWAFASHCVLQQYQFARENTGRVLVCRLWIWNATSAPQVFRRTGLELRADEESVNSLLEATDPLQGLAIRLDGEQTKLKTLVVPTEVTIPAGHVSSFWVTFTGIEHGPFIPRMAMRLDCGGPLTIDLNQTARAELRLRQEMIGPSDCLLLMTIGGRLDSVNLGTLLQELDAAIGRGCQRAVIAWSPDAPAVEPTVASWLPMAIAKLGRTNLWVADSTLQLPTGFRELHFAVSNDVIGKFRATPRARRSFVHPSVEEAVSTALQAPYRAVSRDVVMRELTNGHRLSRLAALQYGADRLSAEDAGLVMRLLRADDPVLRRGAVAALAYFDGPETASTLRDIVLGGDEALVPVAVASLVAQDRPDRRDVMMELWSTGDAMRQSHLIRGMTSAPHDAWIEPLVSCVQSESTSEELRIEALKALGDLGYPELADLVSFALTHWSAGARSSVFSLGVELEHADVQAAIQAYVAAELQTSPPNSAVISYIRRRRCPELIRALEPWTRKTVDAASRSNNDRSSYDRTRLIEFWGELNDRDLLEELRPQFATMVDSERAAYLKALRDVNSPLLLDLTREAIGGDDISLAKIAADALGYSRLPGTLGILMEAAEGPREYDQRYSRICRALATSRMSAAYECLVRVRDRQDDAQKSSAARVALEAMYQRLPGYRPFAMGQSLYEQDRQDDALEHLGMAIKLSPEIPEAWRYRGMAHERLGDYTAAIADYEQWRLREPFLPTPLASLASARIQLREFATAVSLLTQAIHLSPDVSTLYSSRAHALNMQEKYDAAEADYRRALELDGNQHMAITGVALCIVSRGDHASAVKMVEERREDFAEDEIFLYNVACVYSRSYGVVSAAETADPLLATDYRQKAIANLRQAIERGMVDRAWMRDDPDLVPLRGTPEFDAILAPEQPANGEQGVGFKRLLPQWQPLRNPVVVELAPPRR